MARLLMSVDTDFDGTVPIRKILSYLIVQTQIITNYLSTALLYDTCGACCAF